MSKPRLLVVDDEKHIRQALERWFEAAGFEIDLAEDGQEAVEKCSSSSYDVITMDLVMPRMGGLEAVEKIRELAPDVPILIMTASHDHPTDAEALGVSKIMAKPLTLREWELEIRNVLGM
jgi:CheY-like chemotaxis protein